MNKYPKSDCPLRPYHLWDEKEKKRLPSRFYGHVRRACDGAMSEAKWSAKIGTSIAVIDVRYGKLIGQYTLKVKGIEVYEPRIIDISRG